ncbi:MAG: ribosomal protein S18-alanine N-acetyltransferase [Anaerolineales bacterium]|nr:ribosomal protein S18-alanine N-acetyltransferase [Anaerolineales bacterium]
MSAGGLTLRRMAAADLDAVFTLEQASYPRPWTRRSFDFELNDNPAALLWAAEVETGQIAGYCVAWRLDDELHIANFTVAPSRRRQGVGRSLLAQALAEAAGLGLRSAFLEVRRGNLAAQGLYQQFGFRQVGLRPRFYSDGEDAVLMQLAHLPQGVQAEDPT